MYTGWTQTGDILRIMEVRILTVREGNYKYGKGEKEPYGN